MIYQVELKTFGASGEIEGIQGTNEL